MHKIDNTFTDQFGSDLKAYASFLYVYEIEI